MRQFTIKYREGGQYYGARTQEYTMGPYTEDKVHGISKNIEVMGGYDIQLTPYPAGAARAVF